MDDQKMDEVDEEENIWDALAQLYQVTSFLPLSIANTSIMHKPIMETNTKEAVQKFSCNICSKTFQTKPLLEIHNQSHHTDKEEIYGDRVVNSEIDLGLQLIKNKNVKMEVGLCADKSQQLFKMQKQPEINNEEPKTPINKTLVDRFCKVLHGRRKKCN